MQAAVRFVEAIVAGDRVWSGGFSLRPLAGSCRPSGPSPLAGPRGLSDLSQLLVSLLFLLLLSVIDLELISMHFLVFG